MYAKTLLIRLATMYLDVCVARKKLKNARNERRRKELREYLNHTAARYAVRLRFVWDLLDRVELAEERELLVRKYIYQEPIEQICEEMGFSRNTAYRRHREGLQKVQVMLEEPEKGRGCV